MKVMKRLMEENVVVLEQCCFAKIVLDDLDDLVVAVPALLLAFSEDSLRIRYFQLHSVRIRAFAHHT
jgi:hypothetical protein